MLFYKNTIAHTIQYINYPKNRYNYNTKTKDIRVSIHLNIERYSHTNDSIEANREKRPSTTIE